MFALFQTMFQPVIHNWRNKDYGMYYPVYGMVPIKDPLLLIERVAKEVATSGFVSRYLSGPYSMSNAI